MGDYVPTFESPAQRVLKLRDNFVIRSKIMPGDKRALSLIVYSYLWSSLILKTFNILAPA